MTLLVPRWNFQGYDFLTYMAVCIHWLMSYGTLKYRPFSLFDQNHVRRILCTLNSSNIYEVMLKETLIFSRAFVLIVSQKGCQILLVTSSYE